MNWLKKGPDLKLPKLRRPGSGGGRTGPEIKPPAFLGDLYYDLRDRRLLPVIALAIVAIVAVPILLGGDGEELQVAPPNAGVTPPARASKLTVVEATPGLRDYHTRLGDRSPTNPFKQRYTSVPESAQVQSVETTSVSEGGGASSTGAVTESTTPAPEGSSGAPNGSDGGTGGGGGAGGGPPRLIEFVVDVQITHTVKTADGGEKMSEPEVRHRVRSLVPLPGEKLAVVTTGGVNLHNGKVYLLVSDDVKSLDGEFTCIARAPGGLCELLEVELGFPVELVYEPNGARYRVKVTKIDAVYDGTVGDERSSRAGFIGSASAPLQAP